MHRHRHKHKHMHMHTHTHVHRHMLTHMHARLCDGGGGMHLTCISLRFWGSASSPSASLAGVSHGEQAASSSNMNTPSAQ